MQIQGKLCVTNKDWPYIYGSVIGYLNEQVKDSYEFSIKFYNDNLNLPIDEFKNLLNQAISSQPDYKKTLIHTSFFSGNNDKIYKPKRNHFKRYTNRISQINLGTLFVSFDKNAREILINTETFDNFDSFIATNEFISEFINMVNTIDWPVRTGPKITTRGCTLVRVDQQSRTSTIFYKAGPNPPAFQVTKTNQSDETLEEPSTLKSSLIKNISLISRDKITQPIPVKNEYEGI